MLLEIFTDEGVGTQVLPDVPTRVRTAVYTTSDRRRSHDVRGNRAGAHRAGVDRALPGRAHEHVRHAAARARARRGRRTSGTPTATATSTCSAASPSTRSATPTRPSSTPSRTQLSTLGHVSNFFTSTPQIELAEKLLELRRRRTGRVFFTNSGTEANEAAFKATRRTGRTTIVAAEGSFHGRTMGALALTSKEAVPRAVRAAARRRPLGSVRRRRRARGRRRRHRGGRAPRADPGRGRRHRAARRLPAGGAPDHDRARRAAVDRRGADRHRPHRATGSPTSRVRRRRPTS